MLAPAIVLAVLIALWRRSTAHRVRALEAEIRRLRSEKAIVLGWVSVLQMETRRLLAEKQQVHGVVAAQVSGRRAS